MAGVLSIVGASPSSGADAEPTTRTATAARSRLEFGALPALNFNSDIGFGFGAIGVLARVSPDADPYEWRVMMLLFAALKQDDAGDFGVPFQNHLVRVDIPGFLVPRLRLNAQLSFRRFSNAAYYGFGNRTEPAEFTDEELEASEEARNFDRYDRIYPNIVANARIMLYKRPRELGRRRFELFVGADTTFNVLDVYSGSRLEQDLARLSNDADGGPRALRELLRGTDDHTLLVLNLGLLWDSRDHEFEPTQGIFAELSSRWSPGVQDDLRYAGFYLGASGYLSLWGPRVILAGRLATDLLVGDVPFYALSSFGALSPRDGPGGTASTRGVLLQRYIGKIKLISNLELRWLLFESSLLKQVFRLGLNAFFDAGRVWADYRSFRLDGQRLDGPFPELRTGVGGGLHFRWGESFLIRAQFGYSPSDETTGLYIDINHAF